MTAAADQAPPRHASTIVLLRDSSEGLQTLLLRRSTELVNLGGLYVFPGGKLERSDSHPDSLALLDQSVQALHRQLGEAEADAMLAAGLHVAALREALEECGVLLAEPQRADGQLDAPGARQKLHEGLRFDQALSALGLRMCTRALVPWSRWITPVAPGLPTRRFDARFFIAQAPTHQHAVHDNQETTASLWCTPRAALQRYAEGEMDLVPPQIMTLAHLSHYASTSEALAAGRARLPPTIEPQHINEGGLQGFCYPGDPQHRVRERAMPGATRLYRQGRQFLPLQGLDALLA